MVEKSVEQGEVAFAGHAEHGIRAKQAQLVGEHAPAVALVAGVGHRMRFAGEVAMGGNHRANSLRKPAMRLSERGPEGR